MADEAAINARSESEGIVADRELALLCKALGHPARARILRYLAAHGNCYFGDLSDLVSLSPSTISQHVSMLKEAGLIRGEANERRVCYCVVPDRLDRLKRLIGDI